MAWFATSPHWWQTPFSGGWRWLPFLVACSPNFALISMLAQRNSRTARVAQCAVSAPGQIQSIGVSQCPPARGARSIRASASVKVAVIDGHRLHSATTSRFCFRDCHAVGIFVDKIGWLGGERAVPETALSEPAGAPRAETSGRPVKMSGSTNQLGTSSPRPGQSKPGAKDLGWPRKNWVLPWKLLAPFWGAHRSHRPAGPIRTNSTGVSSSPVVSVRFPDSSPVPIASLFPGCQGRTVAEERAMKRECGSTTEGLSLPVSVQGHGPAPRFAMPPEQAIASPTAFADVGKRRQSPPDESKKGSSWGTVTVSAAIIVTPSLPHPFPSQSGGCHAHQTVAAAASRTHRIRALKSAAAATTENPTIQVEAADGDGGVCGRT